MNHTIKERRSLKARIALNNCILRTEKNGRIGAARESTPPTVQDLREALVGDLQASAEFFPAIGRWLAELLVGGSDATILNAD
jgi:hypothetical protein